MLIIVCGLPGSGKTTLAKKISKKFGFVHISSDKIRKELYSNPTYSEEEKINVYMEMAKRVRNEKKSVVDASFSKKMYRKIFESIKKPLYVFCKISDVETIERLKNRKDKYSDATFEIYKKMQFDEFENEQVIYNQNGVINEIERWINEHK